MKTTKQLDSFARRSAVFLPDILDEKGRALRTEMIDIIVEYKRLKKLVAFYRYEAKK